MGLIYEINPPKIPDGNQDVQYMLGPLKERMLALGRSCKKIHITESVLGTSRLSPIVTAAKLREARSELAITASMRTIERDANDAVKFVADAAKAGIEGILAIMGDPAPGSKPAGIAPSSIVKQIKDRCGRTDLFLSIPSSPDFAKIQKKTDARPAGFITQVVESPLQVRRICDYLHPMGFRVIPIVLLPSKKNKASAQFLRIDWSGYAGNVAGFIDEIHSIAGDVLITSPNDFECARVIFADIYSKYEALG